MKDYKLLAESIVKGVGGKENIKSVVHCITRLRFYLKDNNLADKNYIQGLDGVAGVVINEQLGQYQVIIGQAVGDVFKELENILDLSGQDDAEQNAEPSGPKEKLGPIQAISYGFKVLIGTITGSMIPVIGLLAAAGILKGFLSLFTNVWHLIDVGSSTYIIINSIGDAAYFFLPVIVGFTAAKQLKSDPIIVGVIGAVLTYPAIVAMAKGAAIMTLVGVPMNASFFGIPIHIPSYTYSIFPIIVAAWLTRPINKWFNDHLPLALRSIFSPLFTIFIVSSIILVIVGPIVSLISEALAVAINWIVVLNEAVAGFVIGGFYQCLVIFGLHWMVIPLVANDIATTGHSVLNALIHFSMVAQASGALAVFFKTRNQQIRGLSMTGALSGFAGVTEPAMFGINLKYGRIFWTANIGGAVGGFIGGLMHINMYGFAGSLIGFPSFVNPAVGIDNSFIAFCIGSAATVIVSFLCTYFFGFKDSDLVEASTVEKKNVFKKAVNG
jgi:PTS system beta-glucosides-specific IIC component